MISKLLISGLIPAIILPFPEIKLCPLHIKDKNSESTIMYVSYMKGQLITRLKSNVLMPSLVESWTCFPSHHSRLGVVHQ